MANKKHSNPRVSEVRRSAETPLQPRRAANAQLCTAWVDMDHRAEEFLSTTRIESIALSHDAPNEFRKAFEKARYWFKKQWFVRGVTLMRLAFFNFGFAIRSEGTKGETGTSDKVKRWELANRKMYRRYARDAWLEWLVLDNAVGFWRTTTGHPPIVYAIENCRFSDLFGQEELTIRHNLTADKARTMAGFTAKERELLAASTDLKLNHNNKVFGFDVLRREKVGSGFAWPGVAPLFECAAELQSLDVSGAALANACRNIYEQHKMGYEIKGGLHAGSKANHWNLTRAQAFEKSVKGKSGHMKITTNFDHNIVWALPDPKFFEAKRYESGINRIALWSMPIGQMLLGKSLNPNLLPMFRIQAQLEREYVAEHLRMVFIEALGAPEEIKLVWSNRCFNDPRIAADLLKTGLASGPVSQGTFLEEGLSADPEEERERKGLEAKLPDSQTKPLFDAAHGEVNKKTAGRKPGTKDGEG